MRERWLELRFEIKSGYLESGGALAMRRLARYLGGSGRDHGGHGRSIVRTHGVSWLVLLGSWIVTAGRDEGNIFYKTKPPLGEGFVQINIDMGT